MAVAATGALTAAVKARFREQIRMTAIRIPKKEMTTHYMKLLSKYLFNKPRLRNVLEDPNDPNARLLLLEETLAESDLDSRQIDGAGPKTVAELIQVDGLQVTSAHVDVDYSYWPAHVVLRRLLPEGLEVPSSFESVGHIAHLNLREDLLPYKHVIGQVILDKNPRLKSVVNKVASIENEFRVFPMELLAGEDNMETEVRQHGARFKLDFKQVYWNSRLEGEHYRLTQLFNPGEVVLDAMAGIGPFVIPAARKGCLVYANDLNPVSYKYLCTNISLNRLAGKVLPFNADGRAFIRQAAAGQLDLAAAETVLPADTKQSKQRNGQQKQQQKQQSAASTLVAQPDTQQQPVLSSSHPRVFHHIVMNLPASAVEFLDALNGSFCPQVWQGQQLPLVHVYAFAKGEQELAGVRARIEASLGGKLDEEPKQHVVRDVAPGKIMLCLTFRVPASVAFTNVMRQDKRQKTQG
ncbi:tRNA (guanine(37)-N1)-methyltransferase [Chlorella vulgaris]